MRRGLGFGKIVAFCIVVLVLGIIIGFYFGSVYSEAEIITQSFTFTTTMIETVPQTTTKTISHTITEVLPKTITTTTFTTVTESFTETVTVFKEGEKVKVLGICFSRTMDCSSLIEYRITRANESVHVMIYGFTLDDLSKALIDAMRRGVEVKVVIEKENAYWKGSEYERFLQAGVDVRLDGNPYTMHHKVVIVDGKIVVTGSYNWTWSAENRNDENIIILMSRSIAENYEKEIQRVWLVAS